MADKKSSTPPARDEPYLQIGEVAERTGVTQRTLRFYEERGLLKPPTRMDGGFRLYSEDDVARLEHIKQLQSLLGLTLADIKEMVEAEEVRDELRATYRPDLDAEERYRRITKLLEITEHQYEIIHHKVEAMLKMKGDLEDKLGRYKGWLAELEETLGKASVPS